MRAGKLSEKYRVRKRWKIWEQKFQEYKNWNKKWLNEKVHAIIKSSGFFFKSGKFPKINSIFRRFPFIWRKKVQEKKFKKKSSRKKVHQKVQEKLQEKKVHKKVHEKKFTKKFKKKKVHKKVKGKKFTKCFQNSSAQKGPKKFK